MSLATLLIWEDASMAMTFAPASAAERVAGDTRSAQAHHDDVGLKRLGNVAVGDRRASPSHGLTPVPS